MKGMLLSTVRRARDVFRKLSEIPNESIQSVLRKLDSSYWERTRYRPRFNADSLSRSFPKAAKFGTGPIIGGRLAIRVAFHYVPARLKYLKETIDAIRAFPFREISIFIDTNSHEFAEQLSDYFPGTIANVWTDLEHPFKLTWAHRRAFLALGDQYDTFAYIEDDIAIPSTTMRRWLQEYELLAPHGHIPGFLRVEESRDGTLYLTDFRTPVGHEHILEIDGRFYLDSPYPYQACWICHKLLFTEFVNRKSYLHGATYPPGLAARDGPLGVREQVAVGPAFEHIPPGRISRMLVPLDGEGRIAPDTLIAHLPCNYARLRVPHPAMLGTVRLDQALDG